MKPVRILAGVVVLLSVVGGWWWWREHPSPVRAVEPVPAANVVALPPKAFAPREPPRLVPVRLATADQPAQAWERFLAVDGTPREDLAALGELVNGYLHAGLGDSRRAIGFNEDLISALTDRAALGDAALPADHPAIHEGRLLDRWGTPWQVHPLAAERIQLRSAGPDRRLYTADDLVAPEN